MRIKANVSEENILFGKRRQTGSCAVAMAIIDADLDWLQRPTVNAQTIAISDKQSLQRITYRTPLKVREFLEAFDRGDPVEPFEFVLKMNDVTKQKPMAQRQSRELAREYREVKARKPKRPKATSAEQ